MQFIERFFPPPEKSFFLLGPRGSGKTAWAKARFPAAPLVDLDNSDLVRILSTQPDKLRMMIKENPRAKTFVIDEVQRAPDVLSIVHELLKETPDLRFILIASTAFNLRRSGVNLLAGRATLQRFHPLMASEMGDSFDLENALVTGMLPSVHTSDTPGMVLESYGLSQVREQIKTESNFHSLAGLSRFLQAAAAAHGDILNLTKISRDCEVLTKKVEEFLSIVQDLLFAFTIPAFAANNMKPGGDKWKFYFADPAILRAMTVATPGSSTRTNAGAVEGLVAQHLRAWIDYSPGQHELSFHRHPSGFEVHFVVRGPTGFWAVMVKNSPNIPAGEQKSLETFCAEHPGSRPLILHRGDSRGETLGIPSIPVGEFLKQLKPGQPLLGA